MNVIANCLAAVCSMVVLVLQLAPATAVSAPATNVALNHFYVVLDEKTHAAVLASPFFLSRFANVDTGLPKFEAPQSSSQRLYVRGKNTYIELLGPRNPFNEPVGKVGIALGVDDRRWIESVRTSWGSMDTGKVELTRKNWTRGPEPIPWYDVVSHERTSSNDQLVLWLAAYTPEFLPWLYPQRSSSENGVSRADFLAPRFASDRVLLDVKGLSIAVPKDLAGRVADQFGAIGYLRRQTREGLVLEGGGWTLKLEEPSIGHTGLRAVEFSTNCTRGLVPVKLGDSRMSFAPDCAGRWEFHQDHH